MEQPGSSRLLIVPGWNNQNLDLTQTSSQKQRHLEDMGKSNNGKASSPFKIE